MTDQLDIGAVTGWLVSAGLAGRDEREIVGGLAERMCAAGVPLRRLDVTLDTLHPVHEGHSYRWIRGDAGAEDRPYSRNYEPSFWQASPYYHLVSTGQRRLRRRLAAGEVEGFAVLTEHRDADFTDYVAMAEAFGEAGIVGDMDCVYSAWLTDDPAGFDDAALAAIDTVSPMLALVVRGAALAGIAQTLVQTYLGRDAGRRVLAGRIVRGVADKLDAVLWFSDLRGYTALSDTGAPDELIPMLNDYADPVVSAIHANGGDVIKFMGDGLLALFFGDSKADACAAALRAAGDARRGAASVSESRRAGSRVSTDLYLALHTGPVFFGNIGSDDRLDFTAVGPAVNEVSRIAAMCRSVDRPLLMSSAFVEAADPGRAVVASVGRFALRGVARPQELFTLVEDEA